MAPPPKKGTPQNRKPQRGQEVVQVFEPAELVRLYDESVALAWWQRDALPDASQVLAREPFTWTAEVTPSGEELAPLEPLVASAAVLERVQELLELHAALFEAELIGVRVALTQKPLCPSFHLNKQHCRLISTLAGPGTQWVTGPLYAAHDKAVVEQLPSGAAAWFKGLAWPGVQPIPHRSPPGEARRLVLSLDLL